MGRAAVGARGRAAALLAALPLGAAAARPAPVRPLYHATTSGYEAPDAAVLRDSTAWAAAWAQVHDGTVPPPLPRVDFARNSVVLVALGSRPTGGSDVRVTGVAFRGRDAVVRYTATEPGPGCLTAQVVTAPVDVALVPRVAGRARFERAEARGAC